MATNDEPKFVLGVDLDGCVADFLARMKQVYSEWSGVPESELHPEPSYGFPEWGLEMDEYTRLHRFAVTQRGLFESMPPVAGAPQALRRLSAEGVHVRIATHRLFISYFHEPAASQTVRWLEKHGIPYWDLCLVRDKTAIAADLFIEDTARNIAALQACGTPVLCITNASNVREDLSAPRASSWAEAEAFIRAAHRVWREEHGLPAPEPGVGPTGEAIVLPND